MSASFNPDDLNPGIREVVLWLRKMGHETTDSGDGVTNVAAGMEGALPFPHVFIVGPHSHDSLWEQADRLHKFISCAALEAGVDVSSMYVEANYSTADERAILMLANFDDAKLAAIVASDPKEWR